MTEEEMRTRTKHFALRVIRLVGALPRDVLGTVEEEADESAYWMELIIEGHVMKEEQVNPLLQEATELTAIMAASRKSASSRC